MPDGEGSAVSRKSSVFFLHYRKDHTASEREILPEGASRRRYHSGWPWQPIIWAISLFICVLYSFWIIFEISFRLFSPQKVMNAAMMNCCWTKSLYFSVSFSINPMAFKYSVFLMEEDDGLSCFRYSISERILLTSVFIWFRLYQLINVNDRSRNNINNNNSIILLYFWSELFSVWLFHMHVHGPFLLFKLFVER